MLVARSAQADQELLNLYPRLCAVRRLLGRIAEAGSGAEAECWFDSWTRLVEGVRVLMKLRWAVAACIMSGTLKRSLWMWVEDCLS